MGTRTPNYDLYIPGQGEEAWDDEVGGNFTTIDAALQALAAIIDGAVYQINNVTYVAANARWNGSAWNRVDTGSPAVRLTLNSTNGSLEIATAAAGANPITWTTIQVFSATGLDMKSKKVYNLATPTAASDAATKAYIDGLIAALKLSQIDIDADKNWNGKNITNLGNISPISWLLVLGGDPLLITKSHASSTTVTFAQVEAGHGNVKVVVKCPASAGYVAGGRTFTMFKGGTEIWRHTQEKNWNNVLENFSTTVFEDLAVKSGDVLTISRTGEAGTVTVEIYATPFVAPYGIVT